MIRCDYCSKPATMWFTYKGYIAARPAPKRPLVTVAACAEHAQSVNFLAVYKRNPAAKVFHIIHRQGAQINP